MTTQAHDNSRGPYRAAVEEQLPNQLPLGTVTGVANALTTAYNKLGKDQFTPLDQQAGEELPAATTRIMAIARLSAIAPKDADAATELQSIYKCFDALSTRQQAFIALKRTKLVGLTAVEPEIASGTLPRIKGNDRTRYDRKKPGYGPIS
jgi:hypothetical protein